MATKIRANCPFCKKTAELKATSVTMVLESDEDDLVSIGSKYTFDCPHCGIDVEKPVDKRIARLLANAPITIEFDMSFLDGGDPVC